MPTADGWELYTVAGDAKRVRAATKALNAALREAKKELRKRLKHAKDEGRLGPEIDDYGFDPDENVGREKDWRGKMTEVTAADRVGAIMSGVNDEYLEPVQEEYADAGAGDTEPNWVAWNELRKVAVKFLGSDPEDASNDFPQW